MILGLAGPRREVAGNILVVAGMIRDPAGNIRTLAGVRRRAVELSRSTARWEQSAGADGRALSASGTPMSGKIWLLRMRRVVFNQQVMSMTHPLTTTAFDLPGFRITKSFGVVRGIMVRSRSVIGNFGAQIQSIFGGNISIYTNLCERAREDTFNLMLTHAGQLGANAVIGVRYDATEIAPGITEVLCYGTAVFVEKA